MLVQEVLKAKPSSDVATVTSSTQIAEAAKVLADKGIGTVLVSEDGKSVEGILSERDIVRELAKSGGACLTKPVSEYMTRKLVSCTRQMTTDEVLHKMTEGRFRHMPVIEDGELIGLVSLGDVVKAQLTHVTMEKSALESMIMGH
ncbi:CBS domain-containing protein [Chachezhania antarctica]|uniref:CBS domain-containing protein n=1 Tax=Chachezhania antarctica TaxID=2340860 RepID=UPI000EB449BF|nr:CBS domain-containing protein [Chachezhania antarctica]|tara:strand:- start:2542 stop:2976 length:435 start_codon:yes stop_codon:yes gene_type:complete